jgi:hypothetical protein
MVRLQVYNKELAKVLKELYPLPTTARALSHYQPLISEDGIFIPFIITITGEIREEKRYNGAIIKKVKCGAKEMTWKEYIRMILMFLPITKNPCINQFFMDYIRKRPRIDEFRVDHFIVDLGGKLAKIYNVYVPGTYKDIHYDSPFVPHDNHFYFSSMNFYSSGPSIAAELSRLFQYRDTFKEIHIHLNNNLGGQVETGSYIMRCLCGGREDWMKSQTSVSSDIHSSRVVKNLWVDDEVMAYMKQVGLTLSDVANLREYKTKYPGRIILHMSQNNFSAVFYFVTCMVYAFGSPRRFTRECYGEQLKFGTASNNQLILKGICNTCSGDGNTERVTIAGIPVLMPTLQDLDGPIELDDWNRFWIADDYLL